MATSHTATSYSVTVLGRIWQGLEASYDYTFDHEPTEGEIKAKAGDFETVEDYEITKTTRTGTPQHYKVDHEIVTPFHALNLGA